MRTRGRLLAVLAIAATGLALVVPATAQPATDTGRTVYEVLGADTAAERAAVLGSGVDPLSTKDNAMTVTATDAQADALRSAGFRLNRKGDAGSLLDAITGLLRGGNDFPAGDAAYHTYDETTAELKRTVTEHPKLAALSSIGTSYEGRALNLVKISDNAATDEAEPEVLITCNQHAREHLTTEMCLHIVSRYTDGYASDPAIKKLVDSREIYLLPNVNPDGAEFDIKDGRYHGWRKNRQPARGATGTDLNRNWGYQWGCCGGSSSKPADETYRGTAAFSAPETRAVADFVNSRVIGGKQQIKAALDVHTYGELVMWPYGYTLANATDGMTEADYQRHADLGKRMAKSNGYTAQQSSSLYVTDGSISDWTWGKHKILSIAMEMYPAEGGGLAGFYPPAGVIDRETSRNDGAVDMLVRAAS